uniref:Uncharacterized protein n=1 Tax=Xiphophorus maculatus TaxID=8083 RepID=A0A3B5QAV2_XIPMA
MISQRNLSLDCSSQTVFSQTCSTVLSRQITLQSTFEINQNERNIDSRYYEPFREARIYQNIDMNQQQNTGEHEAFPAELSWIKMMEQNIQVDYDEILVFEDDSEPEDELSEIQGEPSPSGDFESPRSLEVEQKTTPSAGFQITPLVEDVEESSQHVIDLTKQVGDLKEELQTSFENQRTGGNSEIIAGSGCRPEDKVETCSGKQPSESLHPTRGPPPKRRHPANRRNQGKTDLQSTREVRGKMDLQSTREADLHSTREVRGKMDLHSTREVRGKMDLHSTREVRGKMDLHSTREVRGKMDLHSTREVRGKMDLQSTREARGKMDLQSTREVRRKMDLQSTREMDLQSTREVRGKMDLQSTREVRRKMDLQSTREV